MTARSMPCDRCASLRAYRRTDWVVYETYRDDAARAHGALREISEEGLPGSGYVKTLECSRCGQRWRLEVMFDHGTEAITPID
jgi:hypothetical protein